MPEIEEKINDIERVLMKLAYMQMNTQINLDNLSTEMKNFKEEIRKDTKDFKAHTRATIDEMNKKWGELANKWGTIVEDLVLPNIRNIAEQYFNCKKEDCEDFMFRRTKKGIKGKAREFDVIAVYPDKVILNETKASPKQDYIDKFITFIKDNTIYEYFPEFKGKKIIPLFASLHIPEHTLKYLTENNIYAMAMKDDIMDILNPELTLKL